jgi:hypothetical protein
MFVLFPQSWFAAGVVNAESAADFARFAANSPAKPVRHWRWLAFRDWTEERECLTSPECRAAYQLGESEAQIDVNLGIAMMCHAILQRNCPADVRAIAKHSPHAAVRRTAEQTSHT